MSLLGYPLFDSRKGSDVVKCEETDCCILSGTKQFLVCGTFGNKIGNIPGKLGQAVHFCGLDCVPLKDLVPMNVTLFGKIIFEDVTEVS